MWRTAFVSRVPSMREARRPWREAPFREQQLVRAVTLTAKRERGTNRYLVWGGEDHHWVNLDAEAHDEALPLCDCGFCEFLPDDQREVCAHGIAALLHEGDPRIVGAIGRMVRSAWLDHRLILHITKEPLGGE